MKSFKIERALCSHSFCSIWLMKTKDPKIFGLCKLMPNPLCFLIRRLNLIYIFWISQMLCFLTSLCFFSKTKFFNDFLIIWVWYIIFKNRLITIFFLFCSIYLSIISTRLVLKSSHFLDLLSNSSILILFVFLIWISFKF